MFNPSKIVCVGLNYLDHAKELNMPIPDHPIIFLKPPTAVIENGDSIIYPEHQTKELHYEAELGIVIKTKIHRASAVEAKKAIEGYTCANDITARDLQRIDGQWARAKGFDTFCPLGPKIVSDVDPDDLFIKLYLNG